MKRLKIGLSVLAVVIGAGSVLASNAATPNRNSMQQTYTWQQYDQDGKEIGNPVPDLTLDQAKSHFNCPSTGTITCAQALEDSNVRITYP